jgi:NAD dependent epimerase/dehydratase
MDISNKRILVTGADGFIGSHLVEALVARGAKVRALSYYNSFNYWGWLESSPVKDKIEIVTGDVRDPHFCEGLCKDIDIVFHLAALIPIPYSYLAPSSFVDTNVTGTLNMCHAARAHNVKKILVTSTSEVYGTAEYVPIDEKHPLQPQSPYSATKIGADAIAMSFYNAFSLPVTVMRPFNTYGPRQSARAIIPTIITQIASGQSTIKLGNMSPTRDLNFVEDTCSGMIALAESDKTVGETVNIGSGQEVSMREMFGMIKKIMNSDVVLEEDAARIRPAKSEVERLLCDNTKIKELTGYTPKHSLVEGLTITAEWFKDPQHLKMYKPTIYNV